MGAEDSRNWIHFLDQVETSLPSNCLLSLSTFPQLESWTIPSTSESNTMESPWRRNISESSEDSISHSTLQLLTPLLVFLLSKEQRQKKKKKRLGYFLFFGSPVHMELTPCPLPGPLGEKPHYLTLVAAFCGWVFCFFFFFPPRLAASSLNGALSCLLRIREDDDFYLVRNSKLGSSTAGEQNNNNNNKNHNNTQQSAYQVPGAMLNASWELWDLHGNSRRKVPLPF